MLNLFKLPLRAKGTRTSESDFTASLSTGLLTSLLKQKRNLTKEEFDQARAITSKEMVELQKELCNQSPQDNYDLMAKALRRIEADLAK